MVQGSSSRALCSGFKLSPVGVEALASEYQRPSDPRIWD